MSDRWDNAVQNLASSCREDARLRAAYDALLVELFAQGHWSALVPLGRMIPWRLADASKQAMPSDFASRGLYIFGTQLCPLLIGKAERQHLWARLGGRYLRGPRSQCNLAAAYSQSLIENGIAGFPEEVRAWYRKRFRQSTVRLSQAVAFARSGIESIWFVLVPVGDVDIIGELERRLIPIANEWNLLHECRPLLNRQHNA